MSKTDYDFKETAHFLDDCVPLSEIHDDVLMAMHLLSAPKQYLTRKTRTEIWQTLMPCAAFIDPIAPK